MGSTPDGDDTAVTHGMCDVCEHHVRLQIGVPMDEYLDLLDAPVAVVGAGGVVVAANHLARGLPGARLGYVEGHCFGEVAECVNSHLPGGCGHTERCKACVIRQAIVRTAAGGTPADGVPCVQEVMADGQTREVHSRVWTRKVGDLVLLRVEEDVAAGGHGLCRSCLPHPSE